MQTRYRKSTAARIASAGMRELRKGGEAVFCFSRSGGLTNKSHSGSRYS
jgi:hypothetical protein